MLDEPSFLENRWLDLGKKQGVPESKVKSYMRKSKAGLQDLADLKTCSLLVLFGRFLQWPFRLSTWMVQCHRSRHHFLSTGWNKFRGWFWPFLPILLLVFAGEKKWQLYHEVLGSFWTQLPDKAWSAGSDVISSKCTLLQKEKYWSDLVWQDAMEDMAIKYKLHDGDGVELQARAHM